jgi:hypothetical protein
MQTILFILILSLSNSVFANGAINTVTKPGRYRIFDFMPAEVAKNKAEEMAREDYKLGNYRHLVFGLRMEDKSYGGYLEQRYSIKDTRVAGCIVTGSIEEATNSYNSTMRQLLTEKYGRDVFKEAEETNEQ